MRSVYATSCRPLLSADATAAPTSYLTRFTTRFGAFETLTDSVGKLLRDPKTALT